MGKLDTSQRDGRTREGLEACLRGASAFEDLIATIVWHANPHLVSFACGG
jgi:hypothetical protein